MERLVRGGYRVSAAMRHEHRCAVPGMTSEIGRNVNHVPASDLYVRCLRFPFCQCSRKTLERRVTTRDFQLSDHMEDRLNSTALTVANGRQAQP